MVRVSVVCAPDTTVALPTLTTDCARSAVVPGVTVIVGSADVTAFPPIVAVIVRAVPAVVPVKVAV